MSAVRKCLICRGKIAKASGSTHKGKCRRKLAQKSRAAVLGMRRKKLFFERYIG